MQGQLEAAVLNLNTWRALVRAQYSRECKLICLLVLVIIGLFLSYLADHLLVSSGQQLCCSLTGFTFVFADRVRHVLGPCQLHCHGSVG